MSTDLCVPAYLGAGGTWREEGQSQSHIPRRLSTLSAFPSGTSATRLVASSTTALDHEYLKGGGVLVQSVWGVVAEKEQRFGIQPRLTRSAYSRRRSLSGTVKQANKGKGLRKKLVKGLECHDSKTVEVAEEHTQPEQSEPIEVEDEDSSTIVCAIDIRLQNNITDSSEQLDEGEELSIGLDSSNSPSTTVTSPFSPTPQLANPHSPKSLNMSSRSSRHSSSSSSSFPSASKEKHLSPPCHPPRSPPPKSPKPTTSTSKPKSPVQFPRSDKNKNKDKDDKDDWHQIHEPEQRRRIQNRIAQRKFREKARSLKDQAARDAQNMRYAGCAYTCPGVEDLPAETYPDIDTLVDDGGWEEGTSGRQSRSGDAGERMEEVEAGERVGGERVGGERVGGERVGGERVLSGLPWGGLSMRFVVGRGHEYYHYQQTSRGSGSGSGTGTVTSLSPTITALGTPTPTPMSTSTTRGDAWPTLQHSQAATYYRHTTSGGSAGASPLSPYGMMMPMGMDLMGGGDMDMDVDYTMVSGAGTGGDYVTSPMAITPGSGSGGHGSALGVGDGMDVTYYDSSPYYYGYGSGGGGGGGDAASGSGGSVYGGGGRGRM